MTALAAILAQHAEDAPFLWLLRDAAVHAPHFDLEDLARHDERLEAQVDGLRVAGEDGWALAWEQAEAHREPGEVFAASVLAIESRDRERIDRVVALAEAGLPIQRGLISALGWVGRSALKGTGAELLEDSSPYRRRLGLAACVLHRVDPGAMLTKFLADPDPGLRAMALRSAGQLGRQDLRQALQKGYEDADPACRFWSAWSALRFGERNHPAQLLAAQAFVDSPFRRCAAEILLRALSPEQARSLLAGQAAKPDRRRALIQAVGACGDPHYVPWLIKQMAEASLARVAGEAFTMIAGADLALDDLEGAAPDDFEAGPTDDPDDENIALDPDEDLPWPAPAAVKNWWQGQARRFRAGRRYLVGREIDRTACREVLTGGYQRQRRAAALELALIEPGTPLFETRAPAWRQKRALAALAPEPSALK